LSDPVTVVVTRRVLPGRQRDFAAWSERLLEAAGAIPGYLGTTVLADAAGTWHIVERFADESSLKAWEKTAARARLIEEANRFSTAERQSLSGLETWFDVPGAPPRWKMAVTTFVAAYPIAYLFLRFAGPHEASWPASMRALLTVSILVPALTWIVMPRLTRLLRHWLRS
jgi:antibiotic biosynthesis monooxygenase (ABM) superfamily enzyme